MEVWRNIIGFDGKYQVSNLGRVKSLNYKHTSEERVLTGIKDTHGYLQVVLYKDGKRKSRLVHRLVAEAFIPNPDNLPEVNHKDEDKTSNVVSNLEYCDRIYNNTYGTRIERVAKAERNHPNTSKIVYQYTMDGLLVRSYPSAHEAERRTGYNIGHISDCCRGERKHYKGFIWSYDLLVPRGKLF